MKIYTIKELLEVLKNVTLGKADTAFVTIYDDGSGYFSSGFEDSDLVELFQFDNIGDVNVTETVAVKFDEVSDESACE